MCPTQESTAGYSKPSGNTGASGELKIAIPKLLLMMNRYKISHIGLARAAGIHRNNLYRILQGENTTLDTINKIAEALEVSPYHILTTESWEAMWDRWEREDVDLPVERPDERVEEVEV